MEQALRPPSPCWPSTTYLLQSQFLFSPHSHQHPLGHHSNTHSVNLQWPVNLPTLVRGMKHGDQEESYALTGRIGKLHTDCIQSQD